jgi:H+/Cl- antiporter ClcA
MSQSWNKVKIWTKLILIGLVTLFILIFCYENHSRSADVWFFGLHTMTVLESLVATFLLGVIATLLARPIYRTLGQISELSKKDPPPPVTPVTTVVEAPKPAPPKPSTPTPSTSKP